VAPAHAATQEPEAARAPPTLPAIVEAPAAGDGVDTDLWAEAALRSLRDTRLSIIPQNFAVWYEYHRGSTPELKRVVDILLSNKVDLSDDKFAALHSRFLGGPQAYLALRTASQRVQQTIGDVLAVLRDAGSDASRFGAVVRRASGEFAARDLSITDLIQVLLSEAQDMVRRAGQIEAELARNAELMKSLQRTLDDARREALTDGLTGLSNRRHFDETLQSMAGQAMNDGTDLSLLLIDIDLFKRINDQWGHPVGDQVIQLVAATLRNNLRSSDFPARYGGEEFAVLLPATNCENAATVGNRLREAFAGNRVVVRETGVPIGVVTVSIGAAAYRPGEPLAEWVQRADMALYEAKQRGRNRVVRAGERPVT
jgi:diguanylate cyclase